VSLLFFLCGLVFGSFGNVLIYRLPLRRSIQGRSCCPHCGAVLRPQHLVPVVSFLLLRGKCSACKETLSLQYPLVELASGLLALASLSIAPTLLSAAVLALALWLLLIIAVIDAYIQGIPDVLSAFFITLSCIYTVLTGELQPLAFLIGIGFFALQWLLSKGEWIGTGDILLAVGLSALLGTWESVLFMLFFAYITGAAVAAVLLLTKKLTSKSHIAFGPFLALGTLAALLVGERMMSCILSSLQACEGLLQF